jgi:hypothetical protein
LKFNLLLTRSDPVAEDPNIVKSVKEVALHVLQHVLIDHVQEMMHLDSFKIYPPTLTGTI